LSIKFLGTGYYVPDKIVTNDELSSMVDTSDDWIMTRVGVSQRRVSTNQTAEDFAVNAAKMALSSSGVSADEIDLIIAASITSDNICPTVAGAVQMAIGAECPAFDINSACSGFMFALETAVSYIERGNIRNALVIGAERMSKLVDWNDRSTCVIFGDGAGAAVICPGDGYLASSIYTKAGDTVLKISDNSGNSPFYSKEKCDAKIFMDGQETFKFAVNKIVNDIKALTEKLGITINDIDHVVTHQANIRIIDFASKRLGIPREKFFVNIEKYGNTSAASVPIALAELNASGKLKRGDIVAMSAFGAGLSAAACIIKW